MPAVSVSTPSATMWPDISVAVLSDSVSGLPVGVTVQAGVSTGVSWTIVFQSTIITGHAAAGSLLQTIALVGALTVNDLVSVTIGQSLTSQGVTFGPPVAKAVR